LFTLSKCSVFRTQSSKMLGPERASGAKQHNAFYVMLCEAITIPRSNAI
jgi:hypothetical protein